MKFSKKSLGQNFFINEHLGEKIISIISKENPEIITEIGPGRGFFTGKLQSICKNLICIEKDNNLAEILLGQYPLLKIYNEDFLNFDINMLPEDTFFFGSLPYNLSKPIIKKIITSERFNRPCFFIIQKEVADKYTAEAPDNNILSLTAQIYSKPEKLFNINSGSFRPKPKVESAFTKFSPLQDKKDIPRDFEIFLNKAFSSPRKTLRNNLKINNPNPLLQKRPAELTLDEYLILFNENLI